MVENIFNRFNFQWGIIPNGSKCSFLIKEFQFPGKDFCPPNGSRNIPSLILGNFETPGGKWSEWWKAFGRFVLRRKWKPIGRRISESVSSHCSSRSFSEGHQACPAPRTQFRRSSTSSLPFNSRRLERSWTKILYIISKRESHLSPTWSTRKKKNFLPINSNYLNVLTLAPEPCYQFRGSWA